MPELDGYQATERIRAMESGRLHTPVIALTACTTPGEQEKCKAAGMDDFIAKPMRALTLKDMLTHWLSAGTGLPGPKAAGADELEAMQQMFGADFRALADLYLSDSPTRIAALQEAQTAGDTKRLARLAHAFSGSNASIGASMLAALCKDLEACAKGGALADAAQRIAMIEAEYGRISDKLRAMIATD
jgi:CheY-like chemotaxis protein